MPEIEIRNIGPIEEFSYHMQSYGLHVLHGRNGCGKTTTLRTVQLAVDGRTDMRPSKRDGAQRGEAIVCGKTIRISKRIIEEGEPLLDGLGDLSISDLHSPDYDRAETRDRHRIKALIRLAGVSASPSLFYPLLGGAEAFDAVVPRSATDTNDLVEMAEKTKAALEREARRLEEQVQSLESDARAETRLYEGIDKTAPHDEFALNDALANAIRCNAQAEERKNTMEKAGEAAAAHAEKVNDARCKLISLSVDPTSLATAKQEVADREATVRACEEDILELERKLEIARLMLKEQTAHLKRSKERLERIEHDQSLHAELRAIIDAAAPVTPTGEEIAAIYAACRDTAKAVEEARSAVTVGLRVRDAIAATERAEGIRRRALGISVKAETLRCAAANVATVLSDAIKQIHDCPLRVRLSDDGDTRLVVRTERSDAEPFDELSDGIKWGIIMRIAADTNHLIVLPQAAYGELSPSARMSLDRLAKKNQCYVLTALADDCEMRGEPFSVGDNTEGEAW